MNKNQPNSDDAVLGGTSFIPKGALVMGTTSKVSHSDHICFCQDMSQAGISTQVSVMRFFWKGATATCSDISQVMSKTQVECLWDEKSKGFVVYPKAYAEAELIQLIEAFEKPFPNQFKDDLVSNLMLAYPHKAIAQNVLDHLAIYFPEEIKFRG